MIGMASRRAGLPRLTLSLLAPTDLVLSIRFG